MQKVGRSNGISRANLSLARGLLLAFLFTQICYGPVKWALVTVGLAPLFYAPKILLIVSILLRVLATLQFKPATLLYGLLVLAAIVVSQRVFGNIYQVAFGLYIFLPFMFGITYGTELFSRNVLIGIKALLITAIVGIILNSIVVFPWSGQELHVAGVATASGKVWSTGGLSRLAGFSSASYSAATQILVLFAALFAYQRFSWPALWLLACLVAIAATTTKGPLIALLLVGVAIWFGRRLNPLFVVSVVFVAILNVLLPIVAYLANGVGYNPSNHESFKFGFFGIGTMFERMHWMWPQALNFVVENGGYLFGTGMGGIGTPMALFYNPFARFASGDSLFVYFFATFGLASLFIILHMTYVSIRSNWLECDALFAKLTIIGILIFGLTGSPVERAVMFMFFGVALSVNCSPKRLSVLS